MHKEALAEHLRAVDISGGNAEARAFLARAYAVSGKRAEAEKILEELKGKAGRGGLSFNIAEIYAGLGRKDEAFEWFEKAYQEHAGDMAMLKAHTTLEPLRSDPRFADLVRRVGLPP